MTRTYPRWTPTAPGLRSSRSTTATRALKASRSSTSPRRGRLVSSRGRILPSLAVSIRQDSYMNLITHLFGIDTVPAPFLYGSVGDGRPSHFTSPDQDLEGLPAPPRRFLDLVDDSSDEAPVVDPVEGSWIVERDRRIRERTSVPKDKMRKDQGQPQFIYSIDVLLTLIKTLADLLCGARLVALTSLPPPPPTGRMPASASRLSRMEVSSRSPSGSTGCAPTSKSFALSSKASCSLLRSRTSQGRPPPETARE
jgi:hypothetical protein